MSEDGTIVRNGEQITLRYERLLHHPVDVVWTALTDPAETQAWFGGRVELDLRVGGRYVTTHQTGDRVEDTIVRLDPPHLLEHTFWQHVNPDSVVTYELEAAPGGCRLILTHRLTAADLRRAAEAYAWVGEPLGQVARTGAGWHRLLDQLEAALAGGPAASPSADEGDLVQRYASQLS